MLQVYIIWIANASIQRVFLQFELLLYNSVCIICLVLLNLLGLLAEVASELYLDSKDHGANMRPTWVLSAPGGPHVGPMNLTIRVVYPMFDRTIRETISMPTMLYGNTFNKYSQQTIFCIIKWCLLYCRLRCRCAPRLDELTHCVVVTPYGDIKQAHH